MNSEVIASLFRQVLVVIGTLVATKGWVSAANWEILSGAILTIGTTGYMLWTRWNTVKIPDPLKR